MRCVDHNGSGHEHVPLRRFLGSVMYDDALTLLAIFILVCSVNGSLFGALSFLVGHNVLYLPKHSQPILHILNGRCEDNLSKA